MKDAIISTQYNNNNAIDAAAGFQGKTEKQWEQIVSAEIAPAQAVLVCPLLRYTRVGVELDEHAN